MLRIRGKPRTRWVTHGYRQWQWIISYLDLYRLNFFDDDENEEKTQRMQEPRDDEGGGVAVFANDKTDHQAEQHGPVGTDAAHQAGDRSHDFRREHIGRQRLQNGGPELVSEHGQAEKEDGHVQRGAGDQQRS